jgi:hypothetical protein
VIDAPVVNVDLSGLESMLRSEIASLGSKLEDRAPAVIDAPVVNVDLSGLESMLRSEIASLGSKLEDRAPAVIDAPVVNVDLSGLESMLRSEIASLGSKLEDRAPAVIDAPVVNVDLSGLESMLRSEIASLGSKLEDRAPAVVEAPVVNVDLSGLESMLRNEIASLGSKLEDRAPATAGVDLSPLVEELRKFQAPATTDDEAIVLRLGALETSLGADLRALGDKFQAMSPEVSLDLGSLESVVRQGNDRMVDAVASNKVDLSGLDALRKDIVAMMELMAEHSTVADGGTTHASVDLSGVVEQLQAIDARLESQGALRSEEAAGVSRILERVAEGAARSIPAPIVEVPAVDLSPLSEGLRAIQEEVFALRDDLASAKPIVSGDAASVAVTLDERVPEGLERLRAQLEQDASMALTLQGEIHQRLETVREEVAKQADLLLSQALAIEALREDDANRFKTQEESEALRHLTLVEALGTVPAGDRSGEAGVSAPRGEIQGDVLSRIMEGLAAVAPLGENLCAHGAQLDSLTKHLETAGVLLSSVPEKLEGSVRTLEESLHTLRANQAEFAASVEIFTHAAEGMAGGLSDKGMAAGTQTAMDGLMEQKAFLDALGKVLAGFSQSLSGVLGESSQRTQEVLVELCARLEGPQA